jgi:hypothetical protein
LSSTAANRFRVGNAGAARMQWTDTNLEIYSSAPVLVASFGATNSIAGWSIDSAKIWNGSGSAFVGMQTGVGTTASFFTGATSSTGAGAKIALNADGSGQIASSAISWTNTGLVTFSDNVQLAFDRPKSAVKILVARAASDLVGNLGLGASATLTGYGFTNHTINLTATEAQVVAFNPDIIILDHRNWAADYNTASFFYSLYLKGYNIVSIGNDSSTTNWMITSVTPSIAD